MSDRTPTEKALNARRRELRLYWKDVHTRAGISHETLRLLRLEEPVAEDTMRAVEDALGWKHGSLDAIRDTGDPDAATPEAPPSDPPAPPGAEGWDCAPLPGGGLEWRLTRLIDGRPASMTIADFDGTPEDEIRRELSAVLDEAQIRQRRRLAQKKTR